MTRMLVPNEGARGIDITTHRGKVKLDADKSGAIDTGGDKVLIQALKAEGFVLAGLISGIKAKGYPCGSCGFNAVFAICGRCGKDNGSSDNTDQTTGEPSVSDS